MLGHFQQLMTALAYSMRPHQLQRCVTLHFKFNTLGVLNTGRYGYYQRLP